MEGGRERRGEGGEGREEESGVDGREGREEGGEQQASLKLWRSL